MTELRPELARYARCVVCGTAYFPVHVLAPCGHSEEPTLHAFDEAGVVYSWTRSHGADGAVPIAMADFLDGELRVTAPVVGADEVAIGDLLVVRLAEQPPFVLAPA